MEEGRLKKAINKLREKGFSGAKLLAFLWIGGVNLQQAALILSAEGYEVRGASLNQTKGVIGAIANNKPGSDDFSAFLVLNDAISVPQLSYREIADIKKSLFEL